MKPVCYTALVTPFSDEGVDYEGLERLCDFQIENGISGILAVGTTGESPTLSWEEHGRVIGKIAEKSHHRCTCIAGTGSNNSKECLAACEHAAQAGVDAVLLVDPYYNGPSSLEIRREYVEPVARRFPELSIIPYVIPGRTGAQLLPEDLAILFAAYPNVGTVKEATGNLDNMRRTRECCGADYTILSGDDGLTYEMMTDPMIGAAGVISVLSNIVPGVLTRMVKMIAEGARDEAARLRAALDPLFGLVTVKTREMTPYGEVVFRARNPLAIKSVMALLGMPSGGCRPPLGKLTVNALNNVVDTVSGVYESNPEFFEPLETFFGVNVKERLSNTAHRQGLFYERY
jgi:4-hydroxy-tetrahydrodipicolinate synthase